MTKTPADRITPEISSSVPDDPGILTHDQIATCLGSPVHNRHRPPARSPYPKGGAFSRLDLPVTHTHRARQKVQMAPVYPRTINAAPSNVRLAVPCRVTVSSAVIVIKLADRRLRLGPVPAPDPSSRRPKVNDSGAARSSTRTVVPAPMTTSVPNPGSPSLHPAASFHTPSPAPIQVVPLESGTAPEAHDSKGMDEE